MEKSGASRVAGGKTLRSSWQQSGHYSKGERESYPMTQKLQRSVQTHGS